MFTTGRAHGGQDIHFFEGNYQIYIIECVENINIFTSAQHELKFWCFQLTRWNIFGIHREKVNFLFILYFV